MRINGVTYGKLKTPLKVNLIFLTSQISIVNSVTKLVGRLDYLLSQSCRNPFLHCVWWLLCPSVAYMVTIPKCSKNMVYSSNLVAEQTASKIMSRFLTFVVSGISSSTHLSCTARCHACFTPFWGNVTWFFDWCCWALLWYTVWLSGSSGYLPNETFHKTMLGGRPRTTHTAKVSLTSRFIFLFFQW